MPSISMGFYGVWTNYLGNQPPSKSRDDGIPAFYEPFICPSTHPSFVSPFSGHSGHT